MLEMVDHAEKMLLAFYVGEAKVSFRMKPMMSPMSPTKAANFKDNPFPLFILRFFTISCNVISKDVWQDPL